MFAGIIAGIVDGVFTSLFGWISRIVERRGLIAQGKSAQYQADLAATVKAGTDAAQVRNEVQASSDSALDADLQRLRDNATSGNK